ncbi:MAG: hypothetical protein ACM3JB_10005 [Acidobacteriaceae bacterium]
MDEKIEFFQLAEAVKKHYLSRKIPYQAIARDINKLRALGAVNVERDDSTPNKPIWHISVKLDWPSTITETEFFARISKMPKSKRHAFLST